MQHRHIINISGGKDSTALLLHALERETTDLVAVFADTGHEHPATYDYVHDLARRTAVPIRWVRADFSAQLERKRAYVATHWLKDLQREVPGAWSPTRATKSLRARARKNPALVVPTPPAPPMNPYQPQQTRYYHWRPATRGLTEPEAEVRVAAALAALQPTGIPFLDLCLVRGRFPSTRARFCSAELKHVPIFEQIVDPLLEQGIEVISWQGVRADESPDRALMTPIEMVGGGLWNYRPLLSWSVEAVFAIAKRHGIPPNPLYRQGMGRVGCMPCIHARKSEMREISTRFGEQIQRLEDWEARVSAASKRGQSTFFSVNKLPSLYHPETGIHMPGIVSVVLWSQTGQGGRQLDLMTAPSPKCSSQYGLCE